MFFAVVCFSVDFEIKNKNEKGRQARAGERTTVNVLGKKKNKEEKEASLPQKKKNRRKTTKKKNRYTKK